MRSTLTTNLDKTSKLRRYAVFTIRPTLYSVLTCSLAMPTAMNQVS